MGRILGIVAVLVVVAVAVPVLYVDSLARSALEDGATATFGVPTEVGSVSLGLFSGRVGVGGFRVANPEGYEAERFLAIERGRFSVGLGTFLEDTVVVPEFVLEDVSLSLEKRPGGSNYQAILANMQKGAPPPDPGAAPGKTFVIRDLRILDVEARLRLEGPGGVVGKSLDVEIPEIRLRDVGSESDGGVVASQVWATVLTAVLQAVVREGASRVGRTAGEALEEAAGGAVEGAGELGGKAGDAVRKGLGGLLGGEEEE